MRQTLWLGLHRSCCLYSPQKKAQGSPPLVPTGPRWGKEVIFRLGSPGPSGWAPEALMQLRGPGCLGCCRCVGGCSHRTSWAGEHPRSFPGHTKLSFSLPLQILPSCFLLPYAYAPAILKLQNVPCCLKTLSMFCFPSLECLPPVMPSGKLLVILQNPAQTSLPLGSSLASFSGELITPLYITCLCLQ